MAVTGGMMSSARSARAAGCAVKRSAVKVNVCKTTRAATRCRSSALSTKATTKFEGGWAKLTPSVTSAAMLGWFLPSSIPVSGFNGNSLTGEFIGSIFSELSHWPQGPSLTSEFWLLCFVWHFGLFLTLTLGQIGWQGKKSGYFK